jgi:WhiB family redox-sensing transcriptional regulator
MTANWAAQAACKGTTHLFFPEKGGPAETIRAAKHICTTCPVKRECLQTALDNNERYGIWGGLTVDERDHHRGIRRRRYLNRNKKAS